MRPSPACVLAVLASLAWSSAMAASPSDCLPTCLLQAQTGDIAPGTEHVVRVSEARLAPGAATGWHTHPSPVTVVVTGGRMIIEMQGREPKTLRAGEAWLEPVGVRMRGRNPSDTEPVTGYLFQVSAPDRPFFEPAAQE